ncbi:MAG TPA: aminotransferase class III-fold pyridoxal phosphate-dependent enzyme [Terrimicrobiaceae bacterium]
MSRSIEEVNVWLRHYFAHSFGVSVDCSEMSLAELGIDSIESAGLLLALENWLSRPIPSTFICGVPTIATLTENIMRLQSKSDEQTHPYEEFVNPYLARKLKQLKVDRSFVRAEGCYLYDDSGERYIDFMAQYGALPFGHNPKEVWDALINMRDEAEPNLVQPSLLGSAGKLAQRLIAIAPAGLRYVTFANSGAEAVEAALKMSRHATGRHDVLSTLMGFHGKTFGALSATGNADYQVPFGLPLSGFDHVAFGDISALEKTLSKASQRYAAFILEPIQGEGGVVTPPAGYLRAAKDVCQRYGVLLIVDEVQTGLGRTGELFACEVEGVTPDIMTLAKALGGGLVPIGACLCTAQVYTDKFAMKHSSTFAGNALAARAGLATLEMLQRDDGALLQQVKRNGAHMHKRLEGLRAKYPSLIEEICGRGFMLGIRFSSERVDCSANFLAIAAQERELAQLIASYLLNVEHVRVAPTLNRGEVLRIQPPLNASLQVCDDVMDAMERAMAVAAEFNTGVLYRAIVQRKRPEAGLSPNASAVTESAAVIAKERLVESRGHHRFAFVMHPLNEDSYADYDTSLGILDSSELREFALSMDGLLNPVLGSSVTIVSKTGAKAYGDFIILPHTAERMLQLSQAEAVSVVKSALHLAKKRGASIVGLGAYSSVATCGGSLVTDAGVPVTSGNSFTVASCLQAIDLAIERTNEKWSETPTAVVGAAGAIGSCMAKLLAERVPRLILVGNPTHPTDVGRVRLFEVAQRIGEHIQNRARSGQLFPTHSLGYHLSRDLCRPGVEMTEALLALERAGTLILTGNPDLVSMGKLVVLSTSFPGQVMDDALFQPGAILCDISRPRSVTKSINSRRPDVLVLDGGIVELPGCPNIGPYGLKAGTAYACMAETILLALEGHFENTSIGRDLSVAEVERQRRLSKRHGFDTRLQSFGKPLTEASWSARLSRAREKTVDVQEARV